MSPPQLSPEATIWTDARHAPLAGELLRLMGSSLKPIGVGGPPMAEVSRLAKELGCDAHDDLRKLCIDKPAAYLLLATHDSVTPDDLHALAEQGTTVLTLEPIASDLQGLAAADTLGGQAGDAAGRVLHVPAFSQSPGYLSAADPAELLGDRRQINFTNLGMPGQGSLFGRLFDSWQAVLTYSLLPEVIDASVVGPLTETPETLKELTGALAAHARMPGAQSGLLLVSDVSATTERTLLVQGEDATLKVADTGYTLHNPAGELLDHAHPDNAPGSFADLLAHQWRRLLDSPAATRTPAHRQLRTDAMACCLACLLSIRTGQPESPGKLLEMGG